MLVNIPLTPICRANVVLTHKEVLGFVLFEFLELEI